MAIKNTLMGGTDWIDGEVLYAADLNDTFDATLETGAVDPTITKFTASGTFRPPDGESWKLTNILIETATGSTNHVQIQLHDGTTTMDWMKIAGRDTTESPCTPYARTARWGECGAFYGDLTSTMVPMNFTAAWTVTDSGAYTHTAYATTKLEIPDTGVYLDYNNLYLTITVAGTAAAYIQAENSAQFGDIGTTKSVIQIATDTFRPPSGETWEVNGTVIYSGVGSAKGAECDLTDGTTAMKWLHVYGRDTSESPCTAYARVGGYGSFGNAYVDDHNNWWAQYSTYGNSIYMPQANKGRLLLTEDFYLTTTQTGGSSKVCFSAVRVK